MAERREDVVPPHHDTQLPEILPVKVLQTAHQEKRENEPRDRKLQRVINGIDAIETNMDLVLANLDRPEVIATVMLYLKNGLDSLRDGHITIERFMDRLQPFLEAFKIDEKYLPCRKMIGMDILKMNLGYNVGIPHGMEKAKLGYLKGQEFINEFGLEKTDLQDYLVQSFVQFVSQLFYTTPGGRGSDINPQRLATYAVPMREYGVDPIEVYEQIRWPKKMSEEKKKEFLEKLIKVLG